MFVMSVIEACDANHNQPIVHRMISFPQCVGVPQPLLQLFGERCESWSSVSTHLEDPPLFHGTQFVNLHK